MVAITLLKTVTGIAPQSTAPCSFSTTSKRCSIARSHRSSGKVIERMSAVKVAGAPAARKRCMLRGEQFHPRSRLCYTDLAAPFPASVKIPL